MEKHGSIRRSVNDPEVALPSSPTPNNLNGIFASLEMVSERFSPKFLVVDETGAVPDVEFHVGFLLENDVSEGTVENFIGVGLAPNLVFCNWLILVDKLLPGVNGGDAMSRVFLRVCITSEICSCNQAWLIAFGWH